MNKLEGALRNALTKGDLDDPIFRRRVYEAAANAIHKSLEAKGADTPERVKAQNLQLAEAIKTIEADLKKNTVPDGLATPQSDSAKSAEVKPIPKSDDVAELAPEPRVKSDSSRSDAAPVEHRSADIEPRVVAEPRPETRENHPKPELAEVQPVKKRPYATLLVGTVAVAALGIGLLWILATGAFQSPEERDTSVPNPERLLESENFEGRDPGTSNAPATLEGQSADSEGWTILFTPSNPTTLGLVDGATADVASDPFGDFARIITPNEVAKVQIDVPLSVLRNSGGKPLQLSLTARSDEGKPTQISVTCDFGTVGECGRHRFDVGQAESEFLIRIDLETAQSATAPGRINLATDIQNQGKAIKLLDVRIRPI